MGYEFSNNNYLIINKNEWSKYVLTPDRIILRTYMDMTQEEENENFINKLASSMELEYYANIDGDLVFDKNSKLSDFLLAYGNFFKKDFIDFILKEALNTVNFNNWTFETSTYSANLNI